MATKYVSSLTGEEMDAALIDMAYHNSEAYAVGTRNGIPVGSSDVTYHNNSKYWAEQVYGYTDRAEDAANRAEAAVPAGTAGAVFFDRAQTLTSVQQAQARANIMAGGSNRNLLDNPWFTVNQRGFTSSTGSNTVKTVDRWEINNGGGTGGTVSVTSEGYISLVTGSTYISYQQKFGKDELAGRTVTISVNDDGNIYSHSFTVPARTTSTRNVGAFAFREGCGCNFFVMPQTSTYGYIFQISISQGYSATIRAVKLELGSVSTLANDAPPAYEQALNDCQYRCVVYESMPENFLFCRGVATGPSNIRAVIDLPRSMAKDKVPTVTMTGSLTTPQGNTITAIASASTVVRGNKLVVNCTSSGLTGGNMYDIHTHNGGQTITISADL